MSQVVINVRNTNGQSTLLPLDDDETLDAVRTFLTSQVTDTNEKVMEENDYFLDGTTDLPKSQEKNIPLARLVKTDDEKQQSYISIGLPSKGSALTGNEGVDRYGKLNADQIKEIFENIYLFNGLTVNDKGFGIAKEQLYSWEKGYMPKPSPPDYDAEITTVINFSKVTQSLTEFGSETASMSFESPYGSAEAEYKHEKSKTTSSEKVKEYITAKFIVRKVVLTVGLNKVIVNPAFVEAVQKAVKGNETTIDGYSNMMKELDRFGFYLPLTLTLGGALISTDDTEISDFSEAESEKEEYSASFKAEFKGVGGGGGYSHVKGSESSSGTSTKYQNIQIKQKGGGGSISSPDDYTKWADDLKLATNWKLAEVQTMYPSLALLASADPKYKASDTVSICVELISEFANTPSVKHKFINMTEYNTVMQEMFDVFD